MEGQTDTDLRLIYEKYARDIASMISITIVIKNEASLHTATVTSIMKKIVKMGEKLPELQEILDTGESNGSIDMTLQNIMVELTREESELTSSMQSASVGFKGTGGALEVDIKPVERVNKLLLSKLGEGRGLLIANRLSGRPVQDNGTVALNSEDIKDISGIDVPLSDATLPNTLRIVYNNLTEDQALQINGPIGKDGWLEASHLLIEENKAHGDSIQVNHAIPESVFDKLLLARGVGPNLKPETDRRMGRGTITEPDNKGRVVKPKSNGLASSIRRSIEQKTRQT